MTTAWPTSTYDDQLGPPPGLKTGVGLTIDLGSPQEISQIDLTLIGAPTDVTYFLADEKPTAVAGLTPLEEITADRPTVRTRLDEPATGQYLVVWLTSLPDVGDGFRGGDRGGRGQFMTTDEPRAGSRDDRSDAELLEAHVQGDADAFGVLFGRHRDRLWAVAVRTMGNPEDGADGLQDGLIAAYRRAASFRGEAQVTTWLHRVVVNACLDRLRAAKVRRAEPLPDDLDEMRRPGLAG